MYSPCTWSGVHSPLLHSFLPGSCVCSSSSLSRAASHRFLALGHHTISWGFLTIAVPLQIVPLLDAPQIIQFELAICDSPRYPSGSRQSQIPNSNWVIYIWGFPGGSDGEESACNVGDLGLIPRLGRSPGEGNGNPLQYSCLGNPMDRGACLGYSPPGCKEQHGWASNTFTSYILYI